MLATYKAGVFVTKFESSYATVDQRYKCVMQGRIYNASEITAKLKKAGIYLKTEAPAEMLMELYRFSGAAAWNELRGDFAIVMIDQKAQKLVAVRDGFGTQPLYYKLDADGVSVASRISKLEVHRCLTEKELDIDALNHYFTFQYIPEEQTYLKNVKHLTAGCVLTYDAKNGVEINPYQTMKVIEGSDVSTLTPELVRETISESIHTRLQGDLCIGTFLSGGIDSTIVAKIAKQFHSNIKAFSIGYDLPAYSELGDAERSAEAMGIELISRVVNAREYWQATKAAIVHLESPLADPSAPVLYLLAELAAGKVDAVLSGEGADELFGGYPIYQEVDGLKLFTHVPDRLRSHLRNVSKSLPDVKGKGYVVRGTTPLKERYVGNAFIFSEEEKAELLTFTGAPWQRVTDPIYEKISDLAPLEQMQTIDLHTWVKGDILLKAQRLTQAHGLEVRMPFLDDNVLGVANELTKTEKILGKTSKALLREAFKHDLPAHMYQMKKRGFPVPLAVWLRGELYDEVHAVLCCPHARQFINQEMALEMLAVHLKGKRDLSRPLWTLIVFVLWLREKCLVG
ncbi:MAG: asparagine synthase (glutamine-hydrolyzing) [Turicibacter sp.]|nr:asparagine synthase (glutamine-hydrolyzing) [Turicibacter sp.]